MKRILFGLSIFLIAGCDTSLDSNHNDIKQASARILSANGSTIETKIFVTNGTVFSEHNTTIATISDTNYVLIGGGCQVINPQIDPGALLTASYPAQGRNNYICESKDQNWVNAHYLNAYAIGLRISGISPSRLRSLIQYAGAKSAYGTGKQTAIAEVPSQYIGNVVVLGGGGYTLYTGNGALLSASMPNLLQSAYSWVVSARDNKVYDSHMVGAFILYMPNKIFTDDGTTVSKYDYWSFNMCPSHSNSIDGTGFQSGSLTVGPAGTLLVGFGAESADLLNSRFLTAEYPWEDAQGQHITAASKNQTTTSNGGLTIYSIGLQAYRGTVQAL
jgi:hypothetical protein